MRTLITAVVIILVWSSSALAKNPLTEDQMSSVTGGQQVDVNNQNSQNAVGATQPANDTKADVTNNNVNAPNQTNANVTIDNNDVENNAAVKALILENEVQRDTRAVNIINNSDGKVSNNSNAVQVQPNSAPVPSVNQTNTVVQTK